MREQEQLAAWQDPPAWNRRTDEEIQYTNDDVYASTDRLTVNEAELRAWLEDPENREWYFDDRTTSPPPGSATRTPAGSGPVARTGRRFIRGLPMKPATNRFAG